MGKREVKKTIAVIGEGITEKFYLESLKGLSPFTVYPQSLDNKASSLKELEKAISEAVERGFDEVYCLIDMDTKEKDEKYLTLKRKYEKPIVKANKGINCKVSFIETKRCTELWFLYYFRYTTRNFNSYSELERELKKFVPEYEKTIRYYKKIGDLHRALLNKGGNVADAIINSEKSMAELERNPDTEISYSEMCKLFEALEILG